MDNIINKMEAYAINLEEIVQSRKLELVEEKKKADALLYRMLPAYVLRSMYWRILWYVFLLQSLWFNKYLIRQ